MLPIPNDSSADRRDRWHCQAKSGSTLRPMGRNHACYNYRATLISYRSCLKPLDTLRHLPKAEEKMVFDKFHVAKHLGEAVDKVRRTENKELLEEGDERLKGTKFDWLKGRDKFDLAAWRAFCQLRRSNLRTARAWALSEQAMK